MGHTHLIPRSAWRHQTLSSPVRARPQPGNDPPLSAPIRRSTIGARSGPATALCVPPKNGMPLAKVAASTAKSTVSSRRIHRPTGRRPWLAVASGDRAVEAVKTATSASPSGPGSSGSSLGGKINTDAGDARGRAQRG
jgi:hypothetical protein